MWNGAVVKDWILNRASRETGGKYTWGWKTFQVSCKNQVQQGSKVKTGFFSFLFISSSNTCWEHHQLSGYWSGWREGFDQTVVWPSGPASELLIAWQASRKPNSLCLEARKALPCKWYEACEILTVIHNSNGHSFSCVSQLPGFGHVQV